MVSRPVTFYLVCLALLLFLSRNQFSFQCLRTLTYDDNMQQGLRLFFSPSQLMLPGLCSLKDPEKGSEYLLEVS